MANRYLNLFKLPERLYAKGSPIIIEAGALHKDSVLGDVVAQLKFRSIVSQNITSVTVDITSFNAAKEIITPSFIYKYENVIVNENEQFFGNKTLITLPDNSTRSFEVKITSVEFADGSTALITENEWKSIPKQTEITSFDKVFVKYFTKTYGSAANVLPTEYNDLWLCTCGQENKKDSTVCLQCGIKYSEVFPFEVEQEKKNSIYEFAKEKMKISNYDEAIKLFESVTEWKDSKELIESCKTCIKQIKDKKEAERLESERKAEIARKEAESIAKRNKKIVIIIAPFVCALIAFIIVLNASIIPNDIYNDAIALMNEGKYAEAISAFEELDGHKDSDLKIEECNTAILNKKYDNAISLMNNGKLEDAYNIFIELNDYKDSNKKASEVRLLKSKETLKNIKVGSCIKFGMYEQDNNTSNGKEYIDWLVLDIKDGKALVISKYLLDEQEYNTEYEPVTWENCTLRKWLNNEFLNNAFTVAEKDIIPIVTVSADKNPEYNTEPGNATTDKAFLLSFTEIVKYMPIIEKAGDTSATQYAISKADYIDNKNPNYWLRTPGETQKSTMYIRNDDYIHYNAYISGKYDDIGNVSLYDVIGHDSVTSNDLPVRPSMWIDLSKIG